MNCGGNTIPTTPNPKYLGVTLDRSLTYTKHLAQLSMKVNARCNLLRRLAGTKWGAHFDVLQTSTTALAFAPAEYCSPHISTRCSSEQRPLTVVRMHPIDTKLHATMKITASRHLVCGNCRSWIQFESSGCGKTWAETRGKGF